MKATTDIEQVKSVARALLMTEVYKTPYSPMVVQHPFTSSGFVATTKDGVMQLIDITESEENLQAWQSFILDEYAREYAYVILGKPITVVSDQERENERFILETFISDISKKKKESYKADAEYIVEWVKSGKNLIVYI